MKKTILLVFVACLSLSGFTQKNKYGYINANEILYSMPEMQIADSSLKNYVAQLERQIKSMSDEYKQKLQDYQTNEANMSPLIKETKQNDLINLEKNIQQFQVKAQEDIQKQRVAIYQPIVDKFRQAVEQVAKENGYKFIIDNSEGVLLYYEETDDIAPLVKKKLGM